MKNYDLNSARLMRLAIIKSLKEKGLDSMTIAHYLNRSLIPTIETRKRLWTGEIVDSYIQ